MSVEVKFKEFYQWFDTHYGVSQIGQEVEGLVDRKWTIKYIFKRLKELVDIAVVVVATVENFSRDVQSLENEEKLSIACDFLDDLIVLPAYLEVFDDLILKLVISWAVSKAKTVFVWGEPVPAEKVVAYFKEKNAELNV